MPAFSLSFPEPDLALLAFDLPGKGANILSTAVLQELAGHLDVLASREGLAGLIVTSGKPGMFIAGADLREFVVSLGAPKSEVVALCRRGQLLFQRLSQLPFVTVAAIDGICVGGGAELAVWCDRRVMSDNPRSEIGFPEVKLGIYPGWGGTVRMPRIVGMASAVEMITSGEPVDSRAALAMGLASDVVPVERLQLSAINLIRAEQASGAFRRDRERWSQPLPVNQTELGFLGATASAVIQQETKGQYPAPAAALELMLETCQLPAAEALQREAEGMAELFGSPINAALINVFFLTDRNKRDTGLDRPPSPPAGEGSGVRGHEPPTIKSVGVIGSGIMGSGIAAATLKARFQSP